MHATANGAVLGPPGAGAVAPSAWGPLMVTWQGSAPVWPSSESFPQVVYF